MRDDEDEWRATSTLYSCPQVERQSCFDMPGSAASDRASLPALADVDRICRK